MMIMIDDDEFLSLGMCFVSALGGGYASMQNNIAFQCRLIYIFTVLF